MAGRIREAYSAMLSEFLANADKVTWTNHGGMQMMELSFARALPPSYVQRLPLSDLHAIYASLERAGVSGFYPGFQSWFFSKVVPGLDTGERCIIAADVEGVFAGVAICKRVQAERKLCTLWVPPALRERGVANALARRAFDWLDTERPLFTIPQERIAEFAGLLRAWDFPTPVPYPSLYRVRRVEYVFNKPVGVSAH